jgi:hypothetical protein
MIASRAAHVATAFRTNLSVCILFSFYELKFRLLIESEAVSEAGDPEIFTGLLDLINDG